jgi:hypothetical protein
MFLCLITTCKYNNPIELIVYTTLWPYLTLTLCYKGHVCKPHINLEPDYLKHFQKKCISFFIAPTKKQTQTATVHSHALPITLPIDLTGTTPKKVDRITLIIVIIIAWHRKPIIYWKQYWLYLRGDVFRRRNAQIALLWISKWYCAYYGVRKGSKGNNAGTPINLRVQRINLCVGRIHCTVHL